MKAAVVISLPELAAHHGLESMLSARSVHCELRGDSMAFYPAEKKLMEVICIVLDHQVPYQLEFEGIDIQPGPPSQQGIHGPGNSV